jgi:transcriptional antiterminator RfaH
LGLGKLTWLVAVHNRIGSGDPVKAASDLGFNCYRPKFMKKIGSKRIVSFLFGRYFFVELCEHWGGLFKVKGISGILTTSENNPAPVQDAWIDSVKMRENKFGFVVDPEKSRFRKGQKLKILKGPFTDNFVLYHGMGRHDAETVLLNMFGRKVTIQVAADSLVPV